MVKHRTKSSTAKYISEKHISDIEVSVNANYQLLCPNLSVLSIDMIHNGSNQITRIAPVSRIAKHIPEFKIVYTWTNFIQTLFRDVLFMVYLHCMAHFLASAMQQVNIQTKAD